MRAGAGGGTRQNNLCSFADDAVRESDGYCYDYRHDAENDVLKNQYKFFYFNNS